MIQKKRYKKEKIGRTRKNSITVFLNDEEFKELINKTKKLNKTKSEVVRMSISDKPINVTELGNEIYLELGSIGRNLNQLAKVANTNGQIEEFKMIREEIKDLSELRKELKEKIKN